jgi:hypothetical protein
MDFPGSFARMLRRVRDNQPNGLPDALHLIGRKYLLIPRETSAFVDASNGCDKTMA